MDTNIDTLHNEEDNFVTDMALMLTKMIVMSVVPVTLFAFGAKALVAHLGL